MPISDEDVRAEARRAARREVLRAARAVFDERGFEGASIGRVARRAGCSVGAVYLHFASKEDLYLSVLGSALARFAREARRLRNAPLAPRERLARAVGVIGRIHRRRPEAHRMVLMLSRPDLRKAVSPTVRRAVTVRAERGLRLIASLLADASRAGDYRAIDARAGAETLWAALLGALHLREARKAQGLRRAPVDGTLRDALAAVEAGWRA